MSSINFDDRLVGMPAETMFLKLGFNLISYKHGILVYSNDQYDIFEYIKQDYKIIQQPCTITFSQHRIRIQVEDKCSGICRPVAISYELAEAIHQQIKEIKTINTEEQAKEAIKQYYKEKEMQDENIHS